MTARKYLTAIGVIWGLVGSAIALEGRASDMKPSNEWMLVQMSPKPIFAAFPKKPTEMHFGLPVANVPQTGVLRVLCTEEAGHTFFVCTLQGEGASSTLSKEALQKTFTHTLAPYLFYDTAAAWGATLDVKNTICCKQPALAFQASSHGEWMRGLTFLDNGQVQHILFLIAPSEQWNDLAANTFLQSVQSKEE